MVHVIVGIGLALIGALAILAATRLHQDHAPSLVRRILPFAVGSVGALILVVGIDIAITG